MLKICQYISCFDNIEKANAELKSRLRIASKEESIYDSRGELYRFFLYSPMPKADLDNPIVAESHGLLLYDDGTLASKLITIPKEISEIPKDADEYREVPDGTMLAVYNLERDWVVSSTESATASEYMRVSLPSFTLGHELLRTIGGQQKFGTSNPELIYVFMLVSQYNTKVMPYTGQEAYLLAIIDRTTGKELHPHTVTGIASRMGFKMPQSTTNYRTLSPGLFIMNKGERYFLSNPIYNSITNALEAGGRVSAGHIANIFRSLRDEKDLDVVGITYTHYERMLELLESSATDATLSLYNLWNEAKDVRDDQKEFALKVMNHPLNFLLFQYKDGKINNISQAVRKMSTDKLIKLAQEADASAFKTYEKLIKLEDRV